MEGVWGKGDLVTDVGKRRQEGVEPRSVYGGVRGRREGAVGRT